MRRLHLIVFLALVIRFSALPILAHAGPDSADYLGLGAELAAFHGYFLPGASEPSIERAPLYPVVLAIPMSLGLDPFPATLVLQAVADTLTTYLAGLMALRLWRREAIGLLAAGMYALSPFAIFASAGLLTETFFAFFLAVATYSLLELHVRRSAHLVVLGGLAAALAILTRPTGYLYLGLVAAGYVVLALAWRRRRVRLGPSLATLALGFVLMSAWTLRNYAVTGLFVPVTGGVLSGPATFYIATRWDLDQRDERSLWPALATDPVFSADTATDPRQKQLYQPHYLAAGLANIRADPLAYLKSRLLAYPQLWITSGDFIAGAGAPTFADTIQRRDWPSLARKIGFLLVFSLAPLVLAAVGLLTQRGWSLAQVLFTSYAAFVGLTQLVLWTETRFLWAAYPSIYGWAAAGAWRVAVLAGAARSALAARRMPPSRAAPAPLTRAAREAGPSSRT